MPRARTWRLVAALVLAAGLGWGLHHVSFLEEHAVLVTLAVIAAATAVGAAAMPALSKSPELPDVVAAAPSQASVRQAVDADAAFCATVHAHLLGHGFFVSLGHRFLTAYYKSFVASPHAVAVVATLEGHRVGMLVGVLRTRPHRRWLLSERGPRLLILAALGFAARPGVAVTFARTRLRRYVAAMRRQKRPGDQGGRVAGPADPAVLSHVAVLPGVQGLGIGRLLVQRFTDAAAGAGVGTAVLATLADDAGAGPFYQSLGWREERTQKTADGVMVRLFSKDLGPPP